MQTNICVALQSNGGISTKWPLSPCTFQSLTFSLFWLIFLLVLGSTLCFVPKWRLISAMQRTHNTDSLKYSLFSNKQRVGFLSFKLKNFVLKGVRMMTIFHRDVDTVKAISSMSKATKKYCDNEKTIIPMVWKRRFLWCFYLNLKYLPNKKYSGSERCALESK